MPWILLKQKLWPDPVYDKYKTESAVNDTSKIGCKNGISAIYSLDCTCKEVTRRKPAYPDNKACDFYYNIKCIHIVAYCHIQNKKNGKNVAYKRISIRHRVLWYWLFENFQAS